MPRTRKTIAMHRYETLPLIVSLIEETETPLATSRYSEGNPSHGRHWKVEFEPIRALSSSANTLSWDFDNRETAQRCFEEAGGVVRTVNHQTMADIYSGE